MTRSFDVFCDLRLNERLSKQSWGWRFETPSCPLWRHSNLKIWYKRRPYLHKTNYTYFVAAQRLCISLRPLIYYNWGKNRKTILERRWMWYFPLAWSHNRNLSLVQQRNKWVRLAQYFCLKIGVTMFCAMNMNNFPNVTTLHRKETALYEWHKKINAVIVLRWCHMWLRGVLNQHQHNCLYNSLFKPGDRWILHISEAVMRKALTFHDVYHGIANIDPKTIITMTSYWAPWRLKSPASPLFRQWFI